VTTVRVDRPTPEITVITLDRPDQLNAKSFELVDDLHAALDEVDDDNSCRVVVLTGAGRGFCSGLDLKSIGPSSRSSGLSGPAAGMRSQERIANLVPHLRRIQQPIIAAINGAA
jgi:enoyl-CoA hydratase